MDYPQMSRRERKKRDTRRRILDAALQLMADRPYDQVRIEDICVAADVANATFFLHFPNKSALALAYNEDVASKVAEQLNGGPMPSAERLRTLLRIYLAEWGAHSHLMRQIVLELLAQPASGAVFNEVSPGLLTLVADVVREGQSNKEFAAKIAPETAALALVAAWNALAISWAKTGDTKHAAEAHWQTLEVFLHGLVARDGLSQL
ncbi:MAG: TetR/AcrR family transcriptional regulator [Alphaproteobacteria bacterium]|nr:TetR/AcrR family transcriptional regulator [Alphaproteobacteria bacterium]